MKVLTLSSSALLLAPRRPSLPSLPNHRRRRSTLCCRADSTTKKAAAAATALAAVGVTTFQILSQQPTLPPVQDFLITVGATLSAGTLGALLLAKTLLQDRFHVELHRGRLYFCIGVPSSGPTVDPTSIIVKPTGDVRGNGAYATALIPAGTFLGEYTGELLDNTEFLARYPDQMADYAMAIDDEYVIDAKDAVADISCFHPVHMNHSAGRANVKRYYERAKRRVAFFTMRDVQKGEELLYDYGRQYWRGRGELELP